MSEPQFIRNKNPHEVSMPEGSHVAASKSAEVGGPTVRQVLIETDENISVDSAEASRVEFPSTVAPSVLKDVVIKLPTFDSPRLPQAEEVEDQSLQMEDLDPEPEMNFPARLIYLKLENDKVRSELDTLEQQMTAGI